MKELQKIRTLIPRAAQGGNSALDGGCPAPGSAPACNICNRRLRSFAATASRRSRTYSARSVFRNRYVVSHIENFWDVLVVEVQAGLDHLVLGMLKFGNGFHRDEWIS